MMTHVSSVTTFSSSTFRSHSKCACVALTIVNVEYPNSAEWNADVGGIAIQVL